MCVCLVCVLVVLDIVLVFVLVFVLVGRVVKRQRRLKKESTYDCLEGLHPVASRNIDNIIYLC